MESEQLYGSQELGTHRSISQISPSGVNVGGVFILTAGSGQTDVCSVNRDVFMISD